MSVPESEKAQPQTFRSRFNFFGPAREDDTRIRNEQVITEKLSKYSLSTVDGIFTRLHPEWNPHGLTEDAVQLARANHGLNISVAEQPLRPLHVLFDAVVNPFNILLLLLASISIGTGDRATFTVMILMIVLSTSLRFWQEIRSLSKAHALVNSVTSRVRVLRSRPIPGSTALISEEVEIDRKQIVPGDVLAVASGDVFPGDCVLISSSSLTLSLSSLTGEIMPVEKNPRLLPPPAGDRPFDLLNNGNICLAGTSVTTGNGTVLVLSTGLHTYIAAVAKELAKRRPVNAMQLGVRKVSFILFTFMMVMAPIVFAIQGAVSRDWKGALLFAIAVAVGITPEMLPMVVASNLALSAVRVARKKAIVKRFDAIQNLGAVSILCSDKTGTLTVDAVRVSVSTTEDGTNSDLPARLGYLNSIMQTGTRSPIDAAIIDYAAATPVVKVNTDPGPDGGGWTKLGEIPFDSSRRLLSVLVFPSGTTDVDGLFITKGAVEEVLDSCTHIYNHRPEQQSPSKIVDFSSVKELTAEVRKKILDTAQLLNEDGLRLVAVACKSMMVKGGFGKPAAVGFSSSEVVSLSPDDEEDLVFVGFLGFLDPPKEDAAEALERLRKLSVEVKILTGDSAAVATKVARDLGLLSSVGRPRAIEPAGSDTDAANPSSSKAMAPADNEKAGVAEKGEVVINMDQVREEDLIVTGPQLAALAGNRDTLREVILRGVIFAKLSPYQKLEVVEILRNKGERAVAFLGDGVNDALAIRGADVGISVDSGTEIAKDAADVILLEKNLGVVADAVVEGRITFLNTIKYVKMAASSNFGNVFSILVASAWLPYQPMQPLQILVQNLLYDFSQGSIPWDNVDEEYILKPKIWDSKSIITFMLVMGPLSSPFDIITFCINWFFFGIRTANNPLVGRAQAHWFIEGSTTQLFIIHYLRTAKLPFFQSRASVSVTLVTTAIAGISMAIPWLPFASKWLRFDTPAPVFYGFLAAIIVSYAALVHLGKMVYLKVFKAWL